MEKTLKTDLFRFVTLRSPQLIAAARRKMGFVEHPDFAQSHFLKEIIGVVDLDIARQKLDAVSGNFSSFASVDAVKDFAGSMWEFSMWLGKNKNNLADQAGLNDAMAAATPFSTAQLMLVWDNVFFDILEQNNPYVRQACLQLLVAQHFLDLYADYRTEPESVKRIANSKVVVPTAFSKKPDNAPATNGSIALPAQRTYELGLHQKRHARLMAEERGRQLDAIEQDLLDLQDRYKEDYEAARKKADAKFEAAAAETEKEAVSLIQKSELSNEVKNLEEVPDDAVSPKEVAYNFDYPGPLSRKYLSRKIDAGTREFIEKNRLYDHKLAEAFAILTDEKLAQKKIASQAVNDGPQEIAVGGMKLRTQAANLPIYQISTQSRSVSGGRDLDIYLSFYAGYPNAIIQDAKFTIQIGSTTMQTFTVTEQDIVRKPSNDPNVIYVLLKTIHYSGSSFRDNMRMVVDGKFSLDNKKTYSFKGAKGFIYRPFGGIADVSASPVSESDVVHYGIQKIGVADYRKVEQELCCYIPGEVSHIENILAREYKEKHTRQLTRSEEILESTTELEVENLSDTTSTLRNEMSSEVSEVIQRDRSQNIGFDTGVSGSYATVTFNAGLSGDFSFSQSATNSDSVSKSYAEDITRRALERVVQKNTVKRTSKILREFEENNKHGYDNRSGERHVTGVFRWIDKVYKNRLVNYGKRLIYEFMVPEPSKFYKIARVIEAQNDDPGTGSGTGTGTDTPVKPKSPAELFQVNSAADIDRGNYQQICAHYGVSAPVPQDEYMNLGGGPFSENWGETTSARNNSYTFQNPVPQDYIGIELSGEVQYRFRYRSGISWKLNISPGGVNHDSAATQWFPASRTESFSEGGLSITGAPTINVKSTKVWDYTLSKLNVKCKLKNTVWLQWQQSVYDDVMAAYNALLDDYNDAVAAQNQQGNEPGTAPEEDEVLVSNPLYNKQHIITELKRLCIEMMLEPFDRVQGRSFYTDGDCGVPQLDLGSDYDAYASQVKFFEQAFDWNILSYIFYPYYWANKCQWENLFQTRDAADHIMQLFLQSGMGRVMVPVREGFEDAVTFFMETGQIWQGTGLVVDTDDELYLSIVDEVTYVEGEVEDEWETIVPTDLNIVQGRSAYLDAEGLPCCERPEKPVLMPDKTILQALEDKE